MFITEWCFPLSHSQAIHLSRLMCTQNQSEIPSPGTGVPTMCEKVQPGVLKGEKNPSSKQGKALLHVMRQILQIAVFAGMCVSHTNREQPPQLLHVAPGYTENSLYSETGKPKVHISTFSCWLLPNTTFGNILLDLLLHTQKTLFSFTPLSLVPSNTWKHISMDTFCMQVCKTALFQHQILEGMKTGAGLPSLRRGTQCWEGLSGGEGDRQLQKCPGFLPSSPWTHSTQSTGLTQGKESPLYLQAAPKHFAEPFDPSTECCFAVELPLPQWGQPHERTFVLQGGFCSFASLKLLLHFAFSCLDAALSTAFVPSPVPLSLPFSIWHLQGCWTQCFIHSQVTTCAENTTTAFLFHLHKPEEIETKKVLHRSFGQSLQER